MQWCTISRFYVWVGHKMYEILCRLTQHWPILQGSVQGQKWWEADLALWQTVPELRLLWIPWGPPARQKWKTTWEISRQKAEKWVWNRWCWQILFNANCVSWRRAHVSTYQRHVFTYCNKHRQKWRQLTPVFKSNIEYLIVTTKDKSNNDDEYWSLVYQQ